MNNKIRTLQVKSWDASFSKKNCAEATIAVEEGNVLYCPNLAFPIHAAEHPRLSPERLAPNVKNVSYDSRTQILKGVKDYDQLLKTMIERFAQHTRQLVENLFPAYRAHLTQGRTSYRPAEIEGRISSYRKDDTRLHVDAFPSTPNQGKRLLRIFTNVNPAGKPRVWRLGEPFEDVARRFLPKISKPMPGFASLLKALGITKTQRSLYDHYMLHIHDSMKADLGYQRDVPQIEFPFPSQTTWIVMTDSVSHAAMKGQHLLEQTFYLPASGMMNEHLSPLRILERLAGKELV